MIEGAEAERLLKTFGQPNQFLTRFSHRDPGKLAMAGNDWNLDSRFLIFDLLT
jgi:hypothetical protein